MLLFFLVSVVGTYGSTPVSECPDATVLHYEWGRLIMADFADNGLLDASVIYGLTPDITAALLVGGQPPYMTLSPSGYLPRLCNISVVNKTSPEGCPSDEVPCCGSPLCGESPTMQTIYTLLVREHNAFVTKVSKGNAGHDPHIFTLARNHVISILASTCPGCRPASALCTADVAADLGRLLTYALPPFFASPACGGVIICDAIITLTIETPIITITPPNTTVTDALNFSYYLDTLHVQEELSLTPAVVAFFESYFVPNQNSTGLLVYLLSERHGPGEEDLIGRLGHALFTECFGVADPVWINTAAVREIISKFYRTTCPVECTLSAEDLLLCPAASSSSGGDSKVQNGSLIFFVVMIGFLTVALFIIVIYKLFI